MTKAELQSIPISFFRHKTLPAEQRVVTLGQALDAIRSPFYENQIKTIRQLKAEGKKEAADEVKNNLHAVTFCATFQTRRVSGMCQNYNNLMVLDIDKLSLEEMERVKGCLEASPLVASFWTSPSGTGYKGLVALNYVNDDKKIDVVDKHHWARTQLRRLDKHRNLQMRRLKRFVRKLDFADVKPSADPRERNEALWFFGKPFSYYGQVLKKW